MISWIVRRIVERGYARQNRGDFAGLARMFSRDAVFEFHGDTRFGGERRGPEAVRSWFEDLGQTFGRLHLMADDVTVSGWPWNMRVMVRFHDRYELINGERVTNYGFQFLRISWGKVKEDRILVDLGIVQQALQRIGHATATGRSLAAPS